MRAEGNDTDSRPCAPAHIDFEFRSLPVTRRDEGARERFESRRSREESGYNKRTQGAGAAHASDLRWCAFRGVRAALATPTRQYVARNGRVLSSGLQARGEGIAATELEAGWLARSATCSFGRERCAVASAAAVRQGGGGPQRRITVCEWGRCAQEVSFQAMSRLAMRLRSLGSAGCFSSSDPTIHRWTTLDPSTARNQQAKPYIRQRRAEDEFCAITMHHMHFLPEVCPPVL